ncbi:hypothetical protein PsorP6_008419 [Peronosclerospora sorghi]|uniref:Uncharacterized protein n=1 Tax=Peronosclerospora sorghi TaxID=230839 RepID=A0ACC0W8C5_9STRA|nr:hypothetical protein PsorP6_008419 [Peronosclerospora sorghi]
MWTSPEDDECGDDEVPYLMDDDDVSRQAIAIVILAFHAVVKNGLATQKRVRKEMCASRVSVENGCKILLLLTESNYCRRFVFHPPYRFIAWILWRKGMGTSSKGR